MSYSPPPAYPTTPQPVPPPGSPKRRNTFGLVALILAIVAFVGAFIPFFNYVAGLIALVALVLGIIALFIKGRGRGTAIAGLIIGFIALLVAIVLAIVYTFVFFGNLATSIGSGSGSGSSGTGIDGSTRQISLIYQVGGTGSDVSVSYTTYADGISATQQQTGQTLPFEQEYTVGTGGAATYNSYTLTATNGAVDGDVTCRIILDGTVVAEQTSTGSYSTASCTASGTAILPK
ncbi:MAG: DUF4190 domain-containing protein [Herbiconiux sp.]|uniref:DUF4190 domain-containing protein n=1 Tax=Herbiconiux sp. TaxID=1871186 RepID=UPI00121FD968|nr:DUF4190 domain-containing protein [Herbiconiux sp.]TAJ46859.1 MAG: DUF4190 domain-containing protein [Herbiconiux sp.]